MASTDLAWPDQLHQLLRDQGVRLVAFVPDAGHKRLIELCQADPTITTIPLTTEEESIPLAAGAHLGNQKTAILMQSSGTGNCINMLSLASACRFPIFMLVTMRGEWGEFNPWQLPMGQQTEAALRTAQVIVQRADRPADILPTAAAALKLAYDSDCAVAILLGQRLLGSKSFGAHG